MDLETTWSRVEAWLSQHAPQALAALRPGADDGALAELERLLGQPLPKELSQLLALHDGQKIPPFASTVAGFMLLPCAGIADAWSEYAELLDSGDLAGYAESKDETARLVWWSKAWIPFAEGPGGDLLCVDLDPGPKGRSGQVIRFWHDEPWRQQLAPSVGELLRGYLQDLGRGQYRVGKTGSVDLV